MNPFAWFRRSHLNDVDDEIRSHLEEKVDALAAGGMSRADAWAEARRAFGNVTATQESARDVWSLQVSIDSLSSDVRYVMRGLVQKPAFAIAVILTLALGIGANAVVFALVNAVVLRPLPYPEPERIVSLSQRGGFERRDITRLNNLAYDDWAQATRSVVAHAAYEDVLGVVASPSGPVRLNGLSVTPAYFGIFGVRPLVGRTFDASEAKTGGQQAIILSEPLWRERFGADSSLVGRTITFNDKPRLVIGVLPTRFTVGRPERYWVPLVLTPPVRDPNPESGEFIAYSVVARLRADASIETARTELATVFDRLKRQGYGPNVGSAVAMTLHERRHGQTRRPLLILFAAVGVLLLTACANIANLSLARASRREREFALRLALGASRWRIGRFVLVENLALAFGGGIVGLLLVRSSLGWFVQISPGSIQETEAIAVSGALLLYTSMIALVTALLFGLVPALTASGAAPNQTLASGTAHAAGSRRQSFARRALVVAELAVALVFLTGAGLVAKTFWRVTRVETGFNADRVTLATFHLGSRYTPATAKAFYDAIRARLESQPGVRSMAYTRGAPMTGGYVAVSMSMAPGSKEIVRASREADVEPEYFETVGAQLVAGRFFTREDRQGAQRVAVVTEGYSARNLKGAPALGKTIRSEECPRSGKCRSYEATIVGVVKDMLQEQTDREPFPIVFESMAQRQPEGFGATLLVRTSGDPALLGARIRDEVKSLDAAQPEPTISSMQRTMDERVAPRKFVLVLLVAFASLAGGLAIIGLYGVLSYLVAERTREIGIRIAVGADSGRVLGMVLGQGLRFTLVGVALGTLLSVAAVRVLGTWMYEMSVYDAPTFGAVAGLLFLVALVASWLPARRASRVDPVAALRAD